MTSVTEIYGTGQKVIAAIIEYNTMISAKSLSPSYFKVDGRTIIGVSVSDEYYGMAKEKGYFVELILDTRDMNSSTKKMIGEGRRSRMAVDSASLTVSQIKPITSAAGIEIQPFFDEKTTHTDNGIMDSFSVNTFLVSESGHQLSYNLYMPKNRIHGQKYPLVLFMHDAGSCSDDVSATLVQGSGAVVWARDSEAGKRPCFVVAPHYQDICANDDYEVTWQADATIELIESLMEQFPIDKSRIYGTGQSMGCMMLCEMVLRNPAFFAGSLLVAGQWDPKRMHGAKDSMLWSIVASGDQKAYPIMSECFENMEKAGGRLCRGHIDAKADMAVINDLIRKQRLQDCKLNFTWFDGESILPSDAPIHPGMHHISTWVKAYDIESLREWLFEQRINIFGS